MSAGHEHPSVTRPAQGSKRCPQCWRLLPWPKSFIGLRDAVVSTCHRCAVDSSTRGIEYRLRKKTS